MLAKLVARNEIYVKLWNSWGGGMLSVCLLLDNVERGGLRILNALSHGWIKIKKAFVQSKWHRLRSSVFKWCGVIPLRSSSPLDTNFSRTSRRVCHYHEKYDFQILLFEWRLNFKLNLSLFACLFLISLLFLLFLHVFLPFFFSRQVWCSNWIFLFCIHDIFAFILIAFLK